MAKSKFNRNETISIIGLSADEYDILYECLNRCKDVMVWDDTKNAAYDNDNFLWEIDDRSKYETLKNLSI